MRVGAAAKALASAAESHLSHPVMGGFAQEVQGMRSPWSSNVVGGAWMALALLGAFSVADAANGRISLSGAVVEPTCTVPAHYLAASIAAPAVDARSPLRLACGQTATNPGRFYARTVVSIDAATIADDRLLAYFASYANAKAPDEAPARLVIRTYE